MLECGGDSTERESQRENPAAAVFLVCPSRGGVRGVLSSSWPCVCYCPLVDLLEEEGKGLCPVNGSSAFRTAKCLLAPEESLAVEIQVGSQVGLKRNDKFQPSGTLQTHKVSFCAGAFMSRCRCPPKVLFRKINSSFLIMRMFG